MLNSVITGAAAAAAAQYLHPLSGCPIPVLCAEIIINLILRRACPRADNARWGKNSNGGTSSERIGKEPAVKLILFMEALIKTVHGFISVRKKMWRRRKSAGLSGKAD
ncbi:hypothetical protein [Sedimenticola sp.]|uniref:hypothetical protein n=1 Tax=Sedimenticola sp. TaxID=1940285 RepID=UPI003D117FC7